MKKIYLILSLLIMVVFVSCEDDYEAPGSLTDAEWVVNKWGGSLSYNRGDFVSIMDISEGALSHSWTIERGNLFLNSDFTASDVTADKDGKIDLSSFVLTEDTVITDDLANIWLMKPGITKVRLYDTFDKSITINLTNPYTTPYDSVNGVYVLDTLISIDVYDYIKPAFTIYKGYKLDEKICSVSEDEMVNLSDSASWKTVTIEAGDTLYCVDQTMSGRPTARIWSMVGAGRTSSGDSIAAIPYFALGNYTGSSLTSSRNETDYPKASVDKYIPLKVNVIKSTKPFIAGVIKENKDLSISFDVTGQLLDIPADAKNDFTVHVKNINGFDEDVTVKSVIINPSNSTKVTINLVDSLYSNDSITVAYNASDERKIVSVDSRVLQSFDSRKVSSFIGANCFEQPQQMSFDVPSGKEDCGCDGWWTGNTSHWFASNLQSYNGTTSLCVKADAGSASELNKSWIQSDDNKNENAFRCVAGSYIFRYRMYIDGSANSDLTNLWIWLASPWMNLGNDISSDTPRDKWVTFQKTVTFSDDISSKISLKVSAGQDAVLFYVDDLELIPINLRP